MDNSYPAHYESEHELRDGTRITVRPIRADDDPLMLEMFHALSRDTIYYRFFTYLKEMPPERLRRLTHVDYDREFALVAIFNDGAQNHIIGVSRYSRKDIEQKEAELAVVVQDTYQNRGVGTLLLRQLSVIAHDYGIDTFIGYVLTDNDKLFKMIDNAGFRCHKEYDVGCLKLVVRAEENPV